MFFAVVFIVCTFVCIGTSLVIFEWYCPWGMVMPHRTSGPSAGIASAPRGPGPCPLMQFVAT